MLFGLTAQNVDQLELDKEEEEKKLALQPPVRSTLIAGFYAGTAGRTQQKLYDTIFANTGPEAALKQLEQLTRTLVSSGQLTSANMILISDKFELRGEFLKAVAPLYEIIRFSSEHCQDATKFANKWVSTTTHGLIPSILSDGAITPDTLQVLLLNTLYFKGEWKQRFTTVNTSCASMLARES